MSDAVTVQNLSVMLGGNVVALKNVSLQLPLGKTIGVIGPSGAGKTTLIRSIVGRIKITDGTVQVLGMLAGAKNLRSSVAYMTQELSVYDDLLVHENLTYFGRMVGLRGAQLSTAVNEVLKTVDLEPKKLSLVSNLSGGQKQRVSLAIALLGSPKLLVLDEPTVGLDPVLRNTLWQIFNDLASKGITLIISSHSMDEARRCDDLVLLRAGKVVAHDSPHDLLVKTKTHSVEEAFLQLAGKKGE